MYRYIERKSELYLMEIENNPSEFIILDARVLAKLVCSKSGGRSDLAQGVLRDDMLPAEALRIIKNYVVNL